MRKFMTTLLSLLTAGAALTMQANAATTSSHPATHCTYKHTYTCTDGGDTWTCSVGNERPCPGNTHTNQYSYSCSECGDTYYDGWITSCDDCGNTIEFDSQYYPCSCGAYTSSSSNPRSYSHDTFGDPCPHGYTTSHTVIDECDHGYSSSHQQTDYINCSSSYNCQKGHTSHATVNHYYCAEHAYVGTSSTCPGLTVSPTPSPMSIFIGQTIQIQANQNPTSATVTYSLDNTEVADMTETGAVTGTNIGAAKVIVTATL